LAPVFLGHIGGVKVKIKELGLGSGGRVSYRDKKIETGAIVSSTNTSYIITRIA